ncbi:MAG: response regulator [Candidatus Eisenbacteria bacterium]|uniref:Response regulator n=1 Tax=Eiseniibacteriota bacterium TaxID=2212470 RepID=A0A956SBD6_UNCEI|nr:response regulator [Candidatus Eisenbacteria bacterium]
MGSNPAILVIDDSEVDRKIIEHVLTGEGYVVYHAHDPAVALWILENRSVELLITDEVMPGQNGHEFVAHLRSNPAFKKLPVVFVSGNAVSPKKVMKMFDAGGPIRFLPKPVSRERLLEEIHGALEDARDAA